MLIIIIIVIFKAHRDYFLVKKYYDSRARDYSLVIKYYDSRDRNYFLVKSIMTLELEIIFCPKLL